MAACETGSLCIYDGNPPETYIRPEDYWEGSAGLNRTRTVANTGLFDFSMWSWCGQASSYSTTQIQTYLDTLAQMETEYPGMQFILMTGHTDGGTNQTLIDNNNRIRQFAQETFMQMSNMHPQKFKGKTIQDWEKAIKNFISSRRPEFRGDLLKKLRARYEGKGGEAPTVLLGKAMEEVEKKAEASLIVAAVSTALDVFGE